MHFCLGVGPLIASFVLQFGVLVIGYVYVCKGVYLPLFV